MAEWKTIPWKSMGEMKHVGHRVERVDIKYRVTGKARYTQDVYLPGMLYGAILRSPHPHAKVKSVDLSAAKAHPKVKAVLDLEKKTVRFVGDEIAAVAAVTQEDANEAIKLIKVTTSPSVSFPPRPRA